MAVMAVSNVASRPPRLAQSASRLASVICWCPCRAPAGKYADVTGKSSGQKTCCAWVVIRAIAATACAGVNAAPTALGLAEMRTKAHWVMGQVAQPLAAPDENH